MVGPKERTTCSLNMKSWKMKTLRQYCMNFQNCTRWGQTKNRSLLRAKETALQKTKYWFRNFFINLSHLINEIIFKPMVSYWTYATHLRLRLVVWVKAYWLSALYWSSFDQECEFTVASS